MYPELTNLLPQDRMRRMRREYFFRLATIFVLALVVVVIIHTILLVPSYVYVHKENEVRQARIAALDAQLSGSEDKKVSARLTQLQKDAAYLTALDKAPSASALIGALLQVPRPGIVLSGFTFTPATVGKQNQMGITGTAATREDLRQYDAALASLAYVASADLPISAYAQESNIHFTIALSGSLTP